MSGRIQPDRTGYNGYACGCTDPYDPGCIIQPYILECMCCVGEGPGCEEGYYDIPIRPSKSTDRASWALANRSYITDSDEVVTGTSRHIWITTDGVTPLDCEDDTPIAYDFLETEYIDVPPIRTRGLSMAPITPETSISNACPMCYEIRFSSSSGEAGQIEKVYYKDDNLNEIEAPVDENNNYMPIAVDIDLVEEGVHDCCLGLSPTCLIPPVPWARQVVFSFCPIVPVACSRCYKVTRDGEGVITEVYYENEAGSHVLIDADLDGNYQPTTVAISQVKPTTKTECDKLTELTDPPDGSNIADTMGRRAVTQVTFSLCIEGTSGGGGGIPFPVCYSVRPAGSSEPPREEGSQIVYYLDENGSEVKIVPDALTGDIESLVLDLDSVSPAIKIAAEVAAATYVLFSYCPPAPFVCQRCFLEREGGGGTEVYWEDSAGGEHIVANDGGIYHPVLIPFSKGSTDDANGCDANWNFLGFAGDVGAKKMTQIQYSRCLNEESILDKSKWVTCDACYEVDYDNGVVTRIYYFNNSATAVNAPTDADGNVMPITVGVDDVMLTYVNDCVDGTPDKVLAVTFQYCPPVPVVCPQCYEKGYDESTGEYRFYLDGSAEVVITKVDGIYPPIVVSPDKVSTGVLTACQSAYEGVNGVDGGGATVQGNVKATQIMFYDCPGGINATCTKCYKVEYLNGNIYEVYWEKLISLPSTISRREAFRDGDGNILPTTVLKEEITAAELADCLNGDSDLTVEDISTVTYIYCPPFPIICPQCYETWVNDITKDFEVYYLNDLDEKVLAEQSDIADYYLPTLVSPDKVAQSILDSCYEYSGGPGGGIDGGNLSPSGRPEVTQVMFNYCPPFSRHVFLCYDIVLDTEGALSEVYYRDYVGSHQDAEVNMVDGSYKPITLKIDQVDPTYIELNPYTEEVTFYYCAPPGGGGGGSPPGPVVAPYLGYFCVLDITASPAPPEIIITYGALYVPPPSESFYPYAGFAWVNNTRTFMPSEKFNITGNCVVVMYSNLDPTIQPPQFAIVTNIATELPVNSVFIILATIVYTPAVGVESAYITVHQDYTDGSSIYLPAYGEYTGATGV